MKGINTNCITHIAVKWACNEENKDQNLEDYSFHLYRTVNQTTLFIVDKLMVMMQIFCTLNDIIGLAISQHVKAYLVIIIRTS